MNTYSIYSVGIVILSLLIIIQFKNKNYGKYLNIKKIFFYFFLIIYLPIIIINPEIYIQDYKLNFFGVFVPDEDIAKKGLSLFLLFLCSFLIVNFFQKNNLGFSKNQNINFNNKSYENYIILIYSILLILSILNFDYRIKIFKYLFGLYSYNETQILRRQGNEDIFIINFFRYSLVFIHVFLFSLLIKKKYGSVIYTVVFALSVVLICGNISKLFYIFAISVYLISILFDSEKKYIFESNKKIIFKTAPIILINIVILAYIYSFIEHGGYLSFFDGIRLVVYRVFISPWTDFLFHVKIFPEFIDFTYFKQSSLISNIFSLKYIPVGEEILIYSKDSFDKNTTIAANFISYAWAFGGYISVITISLIFCIVLNLIDKIIISLRFNLNKIALFSYCISLPIINLHASIFSSFLHYGLLLIPIYFLILEKIFSFKKIRY